MIPYLDCPHPDDSGITLEYYDNLQSIRFLEDGKTVSIHQHDFYEMALILRGSCRHFYRGTYTPLIPGDLFLIPPDQPHSYRFHDSIALCNCQFYRRILDHESERFVSDIEYTALRQRTPLHERFEAMQAVWEDAENWHPPGYIGNINSQGILHLDRAEQDYILGLLDQIKAEQEQRKFGFERIKKMLLETMLIQIKRVQMNQFEHMERSLSWQAEMVGAVLNQIESDLSAEYDFSAIAQKQGISISYFRILFKSNTGLSPLEYLSRVRVLRALELLQTTQSTVAEIAEQVGIHDPNYFARMFKKLIGYPPSYFKSIYTQDQ